VNVSSGTGSPRLSRTKSSPESRKTFVCVFHISFQPVDIETLNLAHRLIIASLGLRLKNH